MNEQKTKLNHATLKNEAWGNNEFWKSISGAYSEMKDYAGFRANGYNELYSFRAAFITDYDDIEAELERKAYAMETTDEYRREYNEALMLFVHDKKKIENIIITELLAMVRGKSNTVTKAAKSKALEMLSVLMGITEIGEDGKTRKVGQMSDFYSDIGTEQARGRSQDGFSALPSSSGAPEDKKVKH